MEKYLNLLYLICFLDAFCTGATLPVLNNYIIGTLKGSHLIVGLLGTLQGFSQIIISPFLHPLTKRFGAKNLLLLSHAVTFMNYFILLIANDYSTFIIFRISYFVFNQTPYLSEVLMGKLAKHHSTAEAEASLSQLQTLGYIVGPLCGGILFHDNSILCVASLLNIMTMLSFGITFRLPDDKLIHNKHPYPRPLMSTLFLKDWRTHLAGKRTLSTLKLLTSVALSAYFMKFSLCLRENMQAGSSLVGFAIAYQHIMYVVAQFGCVLLHELAATIYGGALYAHFRHQLLACVALMAVAMCGVCMTSDFGIYLACFVLLALAREMFERLWSVESEPLTRRGVEAVLKIGSCMLPIVLGCFCDVFAHRAVQVASVLPLLAATWIGGVYLKRATMHSPPMEGSSSNHHRKKEN